MECLAMGCLQHQHPQRGKEEWVALSCEAFTPLFQFEKSLLVAVCRWSEDKFGAKKGVQASSKAATGRTVGHCHKLLLFTLSTLAPPPCQWNVVSFLPLCPNPGFHCHIAITVICFLFNILPLMLIFCLAILILYQHGGTGSFTNTSIHCSFVVHTLQSKYSILLS